MGNPAGLLTPAQQAASRKVDRLLAIHHQPPEHTYLPACLAMATLPYMDQGSILTWVRRAGDFQLMVRAHPEFGLPFGVYPRLLAMWITNEIKLTQSRTIKLEGSYHAFLRELKLHTDGMTRARFSNQANRLLMSAISYERIDATRRSYVDAAVATRYDSWWNVNDPENPNRQITVGEVFFEHVMKHAFPLDLRIVNAFKRSPLALDLYAWLTYRYFTVDKPTQISWAAIYNQFGVNFKSLRMFRYWAGKYLDQIKQVYPEANFQKKVRHLILLPSRTSISRTSYRHRVSSYQ